MSQRVLLWAWLLLAMSLPEARPDAVPVSPIMEAVLDRASGQVQITERGQRVLRYNYSTVDPGDWVKQVRPENLKYARARSDYIHPLYGLRGEELTKDWSVDHPHHRGIYWAWPEVAWHDEFGDLHALQRLFARPTARCQVQSGETVAQIDAENDWLWEDRQPIVHERARVRAYRADARGRIIDLELRFTALVDHVSLARRGTDKYGGLNIRLNKIQDQRMTTHTDPTNSAPRRAWADVSGHFAENSSDTGITILQASNNPRYPGEWISYPELNWLQPTFPSSGERFSLTKGNPLVLRFRFWIHAGATPSAIECAELWNDYNDSLRSDSILPSKTDRPVGE